MKVSKCPIHDCFYLPKIPVWPAISGSSPQTLGKEDSREKPSTRPAKVSFETSTAFQYYNATNAMAAVLMWSKYHWSSISTNYRSWNCFKQASEIDVPSMIFGNALRTPRFHQGYPGKSSLLTENSDFYSYRILQHWKVSLRLKIKGQFDLAPCRHPAGSTPYNRLRDCCPVW